MRGEYQHERVLRDEAEKTAATVNANEAHFPKLAQQILRFSHY
jgi:hypothetical protein